MISGWLAFTAIMIVNAMWLFIACSMRRWHDEAMARQEQHYKNMLAITDTTIGRLSNFITEWIC